MALISTGQVTVGDTATLILAGDSNRIGASILNIGTSTVFFGDGAVTDTTGAGLLPGLPYNIDEPLYKGAIYGVCASGESAVVTFVEIDA